MLVPTRDERAAERLGMLGRAGDEDGTDVVPGRTNLLDDAPDRRRLDRKRSQSQDRPARRPRTWMDSRIPIMINVVISELPP